MGMNFIKIVKEYSRSRKRQLVAINVLGGTTSLSNKYKFSLNITRFKPDADWYPKSIEIGSENDITKVKDFLSQFAEDQSYYWKGPGNNGDGNRRLTRNQLLDETEMKKIFKEDAKGGGVVLQETVNLIQIQFDEYDLSLAPELRSECWQVNPDSFYEFSFRVYVLVAMGTSSQADLFVFKDGLALLTSPGRASNTHQNKEDGKDPPKTSIDFILKKT